MSRARCPFFPRLIIPILLAAALCASLSGCLHIGRSRGAGVELQTGAPGTLGKRPNPSGLEPEMKVSPEPLKLGEARQLDITFIVRNPTKRATSLKFATSQRLEILLRDPDSGKVVGQWSTDRTFEPEGTYLVVNPKERLEFHESIATRDLKAGKKYNVEAYLVGYDKELRAVHPITPAP